MAETESGSGAGIVAIVVIFVILVLAALFVFGGRFLRGGGKQEIDVNISTPSK